MIGNIQEYAFDRKLYESSETVVYRARRIKDNQSVVLKIMNTEFPSAERTARFEREYNVIRSLDAPGVVRAVGLSKSGARWYLVLEDFGGESLDRLNLFGRVTVSDGLNLAVKLADLINQIHQNRVMHRDVNPSNIVLNPITGEARLIDFGIAAVFSQRYQEFQNPKMLEGTLRYISPEQTGRMNRAVDYRTDLYSLGVSLYEILTGRPPFSGHDALELVHAHIAAQPAPLTDFRPDLPVILSDIVLKLMAKNAEDRYQSALGLKTDLERLVSAGGAVEPFELGCDDSVGSFQIPQKLYGREHEAISLMASYRRAVKNGRELLLVTGRPGAGKTALVQEILRPITRDRGLYLTGKFEQYQRRTPYHAFIQAMEDFVHLILAEEEDVLNRWKEKLRSAAGDVGRVLTDAAPALETILGPQPPAPDLGGLEAQSRLQYVFRLFFEALGEEGRPVVIFLDDWQWSDTGSVLLLKSLMTDHDIHNLLLICAYRDNEIDPTHPFLSIVDDLQDVSLVHRIPVGNLSQANLGELLADTLKPQPELDELAGMIFSKTDGNAFFAKQFLETLYHENQLTYSGRKRLWQWDMEQIKALGVTDNVVELLCGRLELLPEETVRLLKLAACIGARFELNTMALVAETEAAEADSALEPALVESLIMPKGFGAYAFIHDHVQQAAYSLIAEGQKPEVHLNIGRLLRDRLTVDSPSDDLFDVVDHLNLGSNLIQDAEERTGLAELNLKAGKRARAAAVFSKAFDYFQTGIEILPPSDWAALYEITLELYTLAAETAYLSGDYETMHKMAGTIRDKAERALDQIPVYITTIQAVNAQARQMEAVDVALEALALLGRTFPEAPGQAEIGARLGETLGALEDRSVEDLADLPLMEDPEKRAAMAVMATASDSVFHARPDLLPLMVFEQVGLSIRFGNAPESPPAYALFGLILCGVVGDIPTGHRFGRLAAELLDRLDAEPHRAKTLLIVYNCVSHWKTHNREGLPHFLAAYRSGLETGDLVFAAVAAHANCYNAYFIGESLAELAERMVVFDTALADIGQHGVLNYHRPYYQSVLNLLGRTEQPDRMAGPVYETEAVLPQIEETGDRTAMFVAFFCEGVLSYYFGKYADAADWFGRAETYIDGVTALFHIPLINYYGALTQAALYNEASADEQAAIIEKVSDNLGRLKNWAEQAPENHGHRHALVEAEMKRIHGDVDEAQTLYREAARLAAESGYQNDEALAWEISARFHISQDRSDEAAYDLQRAFRGYRHWGAEAKAAHLKSLYTPAFKPAAGSIAAALAKTDSSTILGADLDAGSLLKASRIIAGEIHIQSLIEKMMLVIVENAAAGRGVYVENRDGKLLVQAECEEGRVSGILASTPLSESTGLPRSVINYVYRTGKPLLTEEAATDQRFSNDPYMEHNAVKSVLCFPITHQGLLKALIYLENNMIAGAFTPDRLEVMDLLAAQAAVSLQNAELVDTLEQKVEERTAELARANKELEEALQNVKTLSGLLPICSNCKKIRDDSGYWQQVEQYVQIHSQAEFTHSVCPDCIRELYPDIADKLLNKDKRED